MADWKKNSIHALDITGYTAEGMGVARLEGRVVFVPFTIAGERWNVRLEKVNKTVAWGRGVELLAAVAGAAGTRLSPVSADAVAVSSGT